MIVICVARSWEGWRRQLSSDQEQLAPATSAIAVLWLIACAFVRKPRSAPVLLATLLVIYAPSLVESENANWLDARRFRIHAISSI